MRRLKRRRKASQLSGWTREFVKNRVPRISRRVVGEAMIYNETAKLADVSRAIYLLPEARTVDSRTTNVDGTRMLLGSCSGLDESSSANLPAILPNSAVP
jgi:hypothetical protein